MSDSDEDGSVPPYAQGEAVDAAHLPQAAGAAAGPPPAATQHPVWAAAAGAGRGANKNKPDSMYKPISMMELEIRGRGDLDGGSSTASVRGEDSRYRKDISRQLDETLDNMTSILAASCVSDSDHAPASLHAYSDIRVYYKHSFDRMEIESVVSRNFRSDVAVEWVHAPICRDELLVEIEGLAVVPE